MPSAQQVAELIAKYPALSSALIGTAVGAPTGAAFSAEGAESRGALQGALLGAGLGAAGGPTAHLLRQLLPSPEKALAVGGVAGGGLGGILGQRNLSPWVMEHLKTLAEADAEEVAAKKLKRRSQLGVEPKITDGKEASDMSVKTKANQVITKEAEMEKEGELRTLSFEFGMNVFLREKGIDKTAFSKAAGLDNPRELAERTIEWMADQLQASEATR